MMSFTLFFTTQVRNSGAQKGQSVNHKHIYINSNNLITVFVYFNTPLELKKKFTDGYRRFELEWVTSG